VNRRSFMALASGLFVPTVAYSFVGGWSLPPAFVELDDGRVLRLVEKPAVRDRRGIIRPREDVSPGDIAGAAPFRSFFVERPDGRGVMGMAGGKPFEAWDLQSHIVRARVGSLESWWKGGEAVSVFGRRENPDVAGYF
jgi:hypothetical protein